MPSIKTEKQRYARGLKRRKAVLGAKYVEERLKNRHPFTDEFQALITPTPGASCGRGRVRRPHAPAAGARDDGGDEELGRVRAARARRPGARTSPEELKEVLMLAAIYCGVPAANTAFGHARKIIEP